MLRALLPGVLASGDRAAGSAARAEADETTTIRSETMAFICAALFSNVEPACRAVGLDRPDERLEPEAVAEAVGAGTHEGGQLVGASFGDPALDGKDHAENLARQSFSFAVRTDIASPGGVGRRDEPPVGITGL